MLNNTEIHKLIVGTFSTELGQKLLSHLKTKLVDRPIYVKGASLEETAYRQGQTDIIKEILKEMNNGR